MPLPRVFGECARRRSIDVDGFSENGDVRCSGVRGSASASDVSGTAGGVGGSVSTDTSSRSLSAECDQRSESCYPEEEHPLE